MKIRTYEGNIGFYLQIDLYAPIHRILRKRNGAFHLKIPPYCDSRKFCRFDSATFQKCIAGD